MGDGSWGLLVGVYVSLLIHVWDVVFRFSGFFYSRCFNFRDSGYTVHNFYRAQLIRIVSIQLLPLGVIHIYYYFLWRRRLWKSKSNVWIKLFSLNVKKPTPLCPLSSRHSWGCEPDLITSGIILKFFTKAMEYYYTTYSHQHTPASQVSDYAQLVLRSSYHYAGGNQASSLGYKDLVFTREDGCTREPCTVSKISRISKSNLQLGRLSRST